MRVVARGGGHGRFVEALAMRGLVRGAGAGAVVDAQRGVVGLRVLPAAQRCKGGDAGREGRDQPCCCPLSPPSHFSRFPPTSTHSASSGGCLCVSKPRGNCGPTAGRGGGGGGVPPDIVRVSIRPDQRRASLGRDQQPAVNVGVEGRAVLLVVEPAGLAGRVLERLGLKGQRKVRERSVESSVKAQ